MCSLWIRLSETGDGPPRKERPVEVEVPPIEKPEGAEILCVLSELGH